MSSKKYYIEEDLYYSTVYGGGVYEWDGKQRVQDPLCGGSELSPLLVNHITGESFFMKRLECSGEMLERYRRRILMPPANDHVLWPSDMVEYTDMGDDDQKEPCTLFVSREYVADPTPVGRRSGGVALLFPYGGYPPMVEGTRLLAQIPNPNWKEPKIQRMAVQIALALESLNRTGYVYNDMHLSRMYFLENGKTYFDFSELIVSFQDLVSRQAQRYCSVKPEYYPVEFADPAVVRELVTHPDFNSQNYSLCALYFYLFMGRYAYDGRLLTGYVDDTIQNHYMKFRDYHKMPVFIFDPKNTENAIGAFFEEEQVIELWQESPAELRELFVSTLAQGNAERTAPVDNPTPSQWLAVFRKLGWYNPNENQEARTNE